MKLSALGFELEVLSLRRVAKPEDVLAAPPPDPFQSLPAWIFARERVRLLHGESLESFLTREGEDPGSFLRVLVAGEGYRPATGGGSVVFAALEDLAANALRLGCTWVIDPSPLGFSGFTTRATSGFGLLLGGLGFGFGSPDGTFSEGLHLVGTGLVPVVPSDATGP